ncbi:hypothetical protein Ancab_013539 [Ancistrocladus abbreviatus]
MEESYRINARSRPVPRRRSFGWGSLPSNVVADQILHWRESIYKQRLQAVPFPSGSCRQAIEFDGVCAGAMDSTVGDGIKDTILQRIEPWIHRELQAILKDPDPSIIVHVATSLFISSIECKPRASADHFGDKNDFLAPLRRFLCESTDIFWHELR